MMSDYRKAELERYTAWRETVEAIVAELPGFTVNFRESEGEYVAPTWAVATETATGLGICFSGGAYNERKVRVTPNVPPTITGGLASLNSWGVLPYGSAGPAAGIAIGRPGKVAAGEVLRKVVEPYRPMLAAIKEKGAVTRAKLSEAEETLMWLSAVTGVRVEPEMLGRLRSGGEASLYIAGDLWSVPSYGGVEVRRMSLTEREALAVAELLIKMRKEGK
jgi:hypothetical protein